MPRGGGPVTSSSLPQAGRTEPDAPILLFQLSPPPSSPLPLHPRWEEWPGLQNGRALRGASRLQVCVDGGETRKGNNF